MRSIEELRTWSAPVISVEKIDCELCSDDSMQSQKRRLIPQALHLFLDKGAENNICIYIYLYITTYIFRVSSHCRHECFELLLGLR